MTAAPDTLVVTGPNNQQVSADAILVTPTGGAQASLADALASVGESISPNAVTGGASPFPITGKAGAQGGNITVTGGASSTSANAGGTAAVAGGLGGATGAGGPATLTGAAGQGTAAGGAASVTGGASGAGATGNGGVASLTGGAAASTNGSGANATVAGGASTGTGAGSSVILTTGAVSTGAAGGVFHRGLTVFKQGAVTALTTSATLTAAQVLTGILTASQGAAGAAAYQLPLASALETALPADFGNDDAFFFSLINISTNGAESVAITTNTGWTLVGDMDVQANSAATTKSAGRFLVRRTASGAYTLYRAS